jgi:hypothetical protein
MRKFLFILGLTTILACEKTPLLEASESMVGNWEHFSGPDDSHRIIINEDGTGYMEWRHDGELTKSTKTRDWYIDDNILALGKAAFNGEQYEIDKYPKYTFDEIIKYYDTIPAGGVYIILDGNYYVGL